MAHCFAGQRAESNGKCVELMVIRKLDPGSATN